MPLSLCAAALAEQGYAVGVKAIGAAKPRLGPHPLMDHALAMLVNEQLLPAQRLVAPAWQGTDVEVKVIARLSSAAIFITC